MTFRFPVGADDAENSGTIFYTYISSCAVKPTMPPSKKTYAQFKRDS